ncbi:MAG: hypothetical protein L6Q71_12285 [Planctomycetes bacterium]|nr:hypothetical protein [Planctomycetota bacterium]NUQ34736.1 hypothetical protein [Planctomycetaceae bacterium]
MNKPLRVSIRVSISAAILTPILIASSAHADIVILRGTGGKPPRMVEGTLTPTGGGRMKLTLADGSVREVDDSDIIDVRSAALREAPPAPPPEAGPSVVPPEPPVTSKPPEPVPPVEPTPGETLPPIEPPIETLPPVEPPVEVQPPVEPPVEIFPPVEVQPPVEPPVDVQPPTSETPAPPAPAATKFWPLARGAKWVRDNGSLRREIEITDARKDGDRIIYTESTTEISSRSSIVKKREIVVEQRDGKTIYSRMDRGKAIIVLMEPAAEGTRWSAGDGYERVVVSTTENYTDSRGRVHANCAKVELHVKGRAVPGATQYFAPNAGLVSDDFVSFTPPVR